MKTHKLLHVYILVSVDWILIFILQYWLKAHLHIAALVGERLICIMQF